jgi:hypothetical protein
MAKHSYYLASNTLDLHNLKPIPSESIQEAVYRVLDRFMSRQLLKKTVDLTIIVGKGLGSKKFINGKNPLRYYTEQYLIQAGCEWSNGDWQTGQEGVIKVRW